MLHLFEGNYLNLMQPNMNSFLDINIFRRLIKKSSCVNVSRFLYLEIRISEIKIKSNIKQAILKFAIDRKNVRIFQTMHILK